MTSGAGDPREHPHARHRAQGAAAAPPPPSATSAPWPPGSTRCSAQAEEKAGAAAAAKQQARADAIAAKEALAVEAEQIAETSTAWKASGDRLRAIVEEWKPIKGIDRKTDDALWKRFAAARDAFGRRRGKHFAQLDAERGTGKATKERLIARAEELAGSQRLARDRGRPCAT